MSRYTLLITFLAAVGMVAWDEVKVEQRFPKPARFMYVAVIWAVLGIVAEMGADNVAAAFGVGLVLVLAYQHYNPSAGKLGGKIEAGKMGGKVEDTTGR